jgi:hypothetical protein
MNVSRRVSIGIGRSTNVHRLSTRGLRRLLIGLVVMEARIFGERLRQLREAGGLTQEKLAQAADPRPAS